MGVHKLSAGDGYGYLTRQVAVHDSTELGRTGLAGYYSEKGESPGRWLGAGLAGLDMVAGETVTEEQMQALFGAGRHPNAAALQAAVIAAGGGAAAAEAAGALGRPFNVYPEQVSSLRVEVARQFGVYNTERGLASTAAVPAQERARIRTTVATRLFTERHGRDPADPRELCGFIAQESRPATSAVAGYDLTFSPVKSVSTLWALATPAVAAQIEQAHQAAVADTLGWLEREAAFTRVGSGARQVAVRGLVAAAFTHRDSRAGDPDLHTHVAVANKVQTLDTEGPNAGSPDGAGRWLALDGRVLFKANVAASERYNTRLEAELVSRLGLRFVDRDNAGPAAGKRPVREVAGINKLLDRYWSTRRRSIEDRRAVLAEEFHTVHGRTPTPAEATALAQHATLETRDAKHEPRSETDQRTAWRRQADACLGAAREVDAMLADALNPGPARSEAGRPAGGADGPPGRTEGWVADTAKRVVAVLETSRATWQSWHVRAEAERKARTAGVGIDLLNAAVDRVVDHTLHQVSVRLGTPDPVTEPSMLRRGDGSTVYELAGSTRYTSARVLAAEQRLLAAAQRHDGRRVDPFAVGVAVAEAAANGTMLDPAQAAMVHALATSGARLQLALAPAGTGKTTTMAVLARAWADGDGYLLGLAPSAQAAKQLRAAIGGHTDTVAKLTWTLTHTPEADWPLWVQRIGPRTLVVVDEAGQAGTTDLADAVEFIVGRGGSVRLVGDDQQLASVAAGGILRDLTDQVGAVRLTDVHRFTNPAEAAATLAVRDGDPTALGFYADHDRIHVGDPATAPEQAYQAWAADRAAGLDSILLAPTRHQVTHLNTRARTDRLAGTTKSLTTRLTTRRSNTSNGGSNVQVGVGGEVRLVDGTRASAGDTIVTRSNQRRLILSDTDWVKNGDRWTVEQVRADGSLRARHLTHHLAVTLPAGYVVEHVQLGYASTVHAVQGMTVDTAHTVVDGTQNRQLLYVALSRARTANHLYVACAPDGDPHNLTRPEGQHPPTAVDLLTRILARDGSQRSATTVGRDLDDPATQLHQAVVRYRDALCYAAQQTLDTRTPGTGSGSGSGAGTLAGLDRQVDTIWPGLTGQPAWSRLRGRLALAALDGADPLDVLADAAAQAGLLGANDRAAVLDWRIAATRPDRDGPLPWLPPIPAALRADPDWGAYLADRATRIRSLADQVHTDAAGWTPDNSPGWAHDLAGPEQADLRGDLAVWRTVLVIPATDPRPTGPPQRDADTATHQAGLDRRTRNATGSHDTDQPRHSWNGLLPDHVATDPHTPRLRNRLDALTRTGTDVTAALAAALRQDRPLPADLPADALWWRIHEHLDHLEPAAADAASAGPNSGADATPAPADPDRTLPRRWQAQLEHHHPGISGDYGWATLADTLRRAHTHGYDVTGNLTDLLRKRPLSAEHPATDLRIRVSMAAELTSEQLGLTPAPPPAPRTTRDPAEHEPYGHHLTPGGPPTQRPAGPAR